MSVCCECCVLSDRGICDKLITRPEQSYRLWCIVVCDLETSRMRRPWSALGRSATEKKIYIYINIIFISGLQIILCNLLYTSLHTIQIILTSDIFIIIHILFYYSTLNFNKKLYFLILWSFSDTYNYNCILVLKEIVLKITTWVAETCWWS